MKHSYFGIQQLNEAYAVEADYKPMVVTMENAMEWITKDKVVTERAKFSILPRFCEDKKFKVYYDELKKAEDFLNANDTPTDANMDKCFSFALRILDLAANFLSVGIMGYQVSQIGLTGFLSVFGGDWAGPLYFAIGIFMALKIMPAYLIVRGIEWAIQINKQDVALERGRKAIEKYDTLIEAEKDVNRKKELIAIKSKLEEKMAELKG
jgi:hypothetical protein